MIVSQNFTGCIENLYFNGTNLNTLIKDFYSRGDLWGMQTYRQVNVSHICPVSIQIEIRRKHWLRLNAEIVLIEEI